MNRRIFANLILYDIRKGFRENKIKWIVGVFTSGYAAIHKDR